MEDGKTRKTRKTWKTRKTEKAGAILPEARYVLF